MSKQTPQAILLPPPVASAAPQQILYVAHQQTVGTYTVDAATGTITPLGEDVQVAPSFSPAAGPVQVFAPQNRFLYVRWFDSASNGHLSVFATDARGVPQTPAAQTVDLSDGAQVSFDPAGRFGYSMVGQAATPALPFDEAESVTIHEWKIDPQTGMLADDGNQAADPVIGGSYTFVGASAVGNAVIERTDVSARDSASAGYVMHSVDAQTGALGPSTGLYGNAWDGATVDRLALGPKYVANLYDEQEQHLPDFTSVTIFSVSDTTSPLIKCTSTMSDACLNADDIFFDASGNFLFVTDSVKKSVRVLQVDATAKMLRDTGTSIPFTSDGGPALQFSPDSKLVFSIANGAVQMNQFDTTSGAMKPVGTAMPFAIPYALTATAR